MSEYNILGQQLVEDSPPEQKTAEETEQLGQRGTRPKAPSRLKEQGRRFRPVTVLVLTLAILLPTALSAALGICLEQTRTELDQLRRYVDKQPASSEEDSSSVKPEEQDPGQADNSVQSVPEPEHPAYQDLYPEMYAKPAERSSVDRDKVAYLTFDDGPSARTPEVLEILEQYGVKGTFFVIGDETERGKQWMRDIVAAGHTLGIHSYTHDYNKVYHSVEAYLDDFAQMYYLILDTTGVAPQIFRFPGASVNGYNGATYREIISEMVRRGFVYYDWNRMTGDAVKKTPSAAVLVQNALSEIRSARRVIVLMHDSKRYTNMVQALPAIIEGYQAAGFTLEALTPEVRPIIFDYPQ